jgi:hypothetical protein
VNRQQQGVVVGKITGAVVNSRRGYRSIARSVFLVCMLLTSIAGCGPSSPTARPTPIPVVTIENESGTAVDVFSLSARNGSAILQTTLADGGIFNSEPAGSRCDPDGSYFVVATGRRVATLERPGCTGGTLIITREMLTGPEVVVTPTP